MCISIGDFICTYIYIYELSSFGTILSRPLLKRFEDLIMDKEKPTYNT